MGHGKESYLQELKQLARSLGLDGKVHWIQAQSDVRAVYNAVDVFCSSSLTEGFPNVIGEAMACGRHCVVTNVGDSALVVGDTGVVVPSDDAKAMSAGLLDRLNASETMNLRARQRVLENFTVAHLGDKSEYALYQAIEQPYPNLGSNEEVARSVDLSRPNRSRRDADRVPDPGLMVAQVRHHRALPDSGRTGKNGQPISSWHQAQSGPEQTRDATPRADAFPARALDDLRRSRSSP